MESAEALAALETAEVAPVDTLAAVEPDASEALSVADEVAAEDADALAAAEVANADGGG